MKKVGIDISLTAFFIFLILFFIFSFFLGAYSVSAEENFTIVTGTNYNVNAEYVYNKLFNNTGYDYSDYPYILVKYSYYVDGGDYARLELYAFPSLDNVYATSYSSYNKNYTLNGGSLISSHLYYSERILKSNGSLSNIINTYVQSVQSSTGLILSYTGNGNTSNSSNKFYTNFDFIYNGSVASNNSSINKLDFTSYSSKTLFDINVYNEDDILIQAKICKNTDFKYSNFCGLTLDLDNAYYVTVNYHLDNYDSDFIINNGTYRLFFNQLYNDHAQYWLNDFKIGYFDSNNNYNEFSPNLWSMTGTQHDEITSQVLSFGTDLNVGNVSNFILKFKVNNPVDSSFYISDFLTFEAYDIFMNENLFSNNTDFKRVCVDINSIFAIKTVDYVLDSDNHKLYNAYDFIWYKGYFDDIKISLYDTNANGNFVPIIQDNFLNRVYKFDNFDTINSYFNNPEFRIIFSVSGYGSSGLNYYGYTAIPFYNNFTSEQLKFSVFEFKNKSNISNSIDDNSNKIYKCFYLKNNYDIVVFKKNAFGDIYDDDFVVLGDDHRHIESSYNFDSLDSRGLFSSVSNFISSISDNLGFVKDRIYELYLSMPVILRGFIITLLTLCVIKFVLLVVLK